MTFLIGLFLRLGIPQRISRPVAIATTLIAVIALTAFLWTCWLSKRDAKVIADDRAVANVEKAQAVTKADREANAKADVRDTALAEQQRDLNDAAKKGDDSPVGVGTESVYDQLRNRKAN
jgi:hypothetical protein